MIIKRHLVGDGAISSSVTKSTTENNYDGTPEDLPSTTHSDPMNEISTQNEVYLNTSFRKTHSES